MNRKEDQHEQFTRTLFVKKPIRDKEAERLLELQAQSNLDLARSVSSRQLRKTTEIRPAQNRRRRRKTRGIGHIEYLHPELQSLLLAQS